ncbi:MAG: carboxypeptidase-like regulatory domain-containing protein [Candidatus Obscuribacterales bacterium]|nr:carboxypeptidase-like regulatory domain-containing protein [Candidatus Obscuribacterales bacterium]
MVKIPVQSDKTTQQVLSILSGLWQTALRQILGVIIALLILMIPSFAADEEAPSKLKGRIIDPQGQGVAQAKVIVTDENNQKQYKGQSNRDGYFSVDHSACESLSFDVIPQNKHGLSQAHFHDVDGNTTKHFIVQLQQGFQINGRVVYGGIGVKGLNIEVVSHDDEPTSKGIVHGGGSTKTLADGKFCLRLTPGKKTINITNEIYSNVPESFSQDFIVSSDSQLPDIIIPAKKKTKSNKGS